MEGMIGLVSCLLCAWPFLIMACFGKDSKTPISFWSGDQSLSDRITNVKDYNAKMAKLYGRCAAAFVIAGICCLVFWVIGIALVLAECTFGLYYVYKSYKKMLNAYTDADEEG